ncbi:ABC transporter permease [Luteibacter sp. ME-Dv--P-043b]|uniref:ABC transporter permease n=1 Tax=Luteibacter sp. ME-Dv--P-043b TaxID=3040291 RepID=UPI00255719D0|nr:ABC transporter permease [Luteibacter sp. ME-Dv--P-043b]
MSGWVASCLHAWAAMLRRPGFFVLAVSTLAIGIAALSAALTLVDALLWRPLPFVDSERVALYGARYRDDPTPIASPRYVAAMDDLPGVASRGATRLPRAMNVIFDERRWLLHGEGVDAGFLDTLGVVPALGRNLTDEYGAMVSYEVWQHRLGGRKDVVGHSLTVEGHRLSIVGVLPRGYRFLTDVDVVVPLGIAGADDDTAENLIPVARLGAGMHVQALSDAVAARARAQAGRPGIDTGDGANFGATSLRHVLTWQARPALLGMLGAAVGVLVIAGINLSNLMLGRGLARSRDTAIRMALGAHALTPWSIAAAEAAAIGLAAAALGIPLGDVVVDVFRDVVPAAWRSTSLPVEASTTVRWLTGCADALLVAVAAASASVHDRIDDLLRERVAIAGSAGPGRMARYARRGMVLVQAAMASALLVFGVAALARCLRLESIAPGFDAKDAYFAPLQPDMVSYPARTDVSDLFDALRRDAYTASPDGAMGFTNLLPLGDGLVMPFLDAAGRRHFVRYAIVTQGAAEAMGLNRLLGRAFDAGDHAGTPRVAWVNQTFRQTMGGGLGDIARPDSHLAPMPPLRIVGVTADTRVAGAGERAVATVFVPLKQVDATVFTFIRRLMPMYAVWRRSPVGSTDNGDAFERRLRTVAPGLAAGDTRPLGDLVRAVTAAARRNAVLLCALSLAALFLAAVGQYSSQSVDMAGRRRELALRVALGAPQRRLAHDVVTRYLAIACLGALLGVAGVLLSRSYTRVDDIDGVVVAVACLVFVTAALVAAVVPGWRAITMEPLAVLRGG